MMRFKSNKQRKAVMAKISELRNMQGRYLYNSSHDSKYTANAGDYWNMKPQQKFVGMTLMKGGKVIKEEPSKKDLVDEIYISQDIHRLQNKLRPILSKKEQKATSIGGKQFDEKGRFLVNGKPSDTWTFEGIANIYGRKVMDWDEFVRDPSKIRSLRGKLFIMDRDNGTDRINSKPINKARYW